MSARPPRVDWDEPQTWYFTFGSAHRNAKRYYVVENATCDEARDRMFDVFGREWAFRRNVAGRPLGTGARPVIRPGSHHAAILLDEPVYGPDERFRVYAYRGGALRLLATCPNPDSVGVALVTLHADAKACDPPRRLCDEGVIGVLDGDEHDWVVNPFPRGA